MVCGEVREHRHRYRRSWMFRAAGARAAGSTRQRPAQMLRALALLRHPSSSRPRHTLAAAWRRARPPRLALPRLALRPPRARPRRAALLLVATASGACWAAAQAVRPRCAEAVHRVEWTADQIRDLLDDYLTARSLENYAAALGIVGLVLADMMAFTLTGIFGALIGGIGTVCYVYDHLEHVNGDEHGRLRFNDVSVAHEELLGLLEYHNVRKESRMMPVNSPEHERVARVGRRIAAATLLQGGDDAEDQERRAQWAFHCQDTDEANVRPDAAIPTARAARSPPDDAPLCSCRRSFCRAAKCSSAAACWRSARRTRSWQSSWRMRLATCKPGTQRSASRCRGSRRYSRAASCCWRGRERCRSRLRQRCSGFPSWAASTWRLTCCSHSPTPGRERARLPARWPAWPGSPRPHRCQMTFIGRD